MSQDEQKQPQSGRAAETQPLQNPGRPEEVVQSEGHQVEEAQTGSRPTPPKPPSKPETPPPAVKEAFMPDVDRFLEPQEEPEIEIEDEKGWFTWKVPSLGWFVLGGILICIIPVIVKVAFFTPPPVEQELKKVQKAKKIQKAQISKKDEEEKKLLAKEEEATKQIRQMLMRMNASVKGYLSADSIDQKVLYVRHPERVKPLMEQYYKDHQMLAEQFRRFANYRAIAIDDSSFVIGRVELTDGATHELLLERFQDGSFKVDWESDVCYLPIAWDEFIRGRPSKPLAMRVLVKPDNFYAYEFSDDTQYDCYRLTTRDSGDPLFGYVVKGSEVSIAMRRFFMQTRQQGSGKVEPFTLVLRFPENSRSRKCVHIDQVLARRWLFVNESEAEVGE